MTKHEQQVKYYYNKDSKKLYKVTNCKHIKMWYTSLKEWKVCCSSARDVLNGFYKDVYIMVNEYELGDYK
ncbi:MAG: hypothetical protein RR959_08015 [Erysipelotrichaceae bacterium]